MTPLVLLWLVTSGRTTLALMFAAFILPAVVRGGLRWHRLFGPPNGMGANVSDCAGDFDADIVPGRTVAGAPFDPNVVRRALVALSAYIECAARRDSSKSTDRHFSKRTLRRAGNGSGDRRLSLQDAQNILGLAPTAGPRQICEAHCRLPDNCSRNSVIRIT